MKPYPWTRRYIVLVLTLLVVLQVVELVRH